MSLPVAFAAGLAAFFSPCILPLLPVWLAFMGGDQAKSKVKLVKNLLLFAAGFTLIFTAMGAGATLAGQLLRECRLVFMRIAGGIVIIFGLQMLGLFKLSFINQERKLKIARRRSPGGYFLFGIALAFGWTPCTGMILGPIIMLAGSLDTVYQGMLLLFIYSLGFALPFFITGLVLGSVPPIKSGKISRFVQIAAGSVMVLMGILLLLNRWTWLQSLVL